MDKQQDRIDRIGLSKFTSAKSLIFSASSAGIIACDIEKATPPTKITMIKF